MEFLRLFLRCHLAGKLRVVKMRRDRRYRRLLCTFHWLLIVGENRIEKEIVFIMP